MKIRMHYKQITIVLALLLTSCNTTSNKLADNEFHIKVEIKDLVDGTKIVLKKQENNSTISLDSTTSSDHKFEFKGILESPTMLGIFIDSIKGGLFPLVENGEISITAQKDSLYAPTITGSELNDELQKFKDGSQKIVSKINDLFIQIQKARSENDLQKINEINRKMRAINDENTRYSLDYAKNNPNSFVSSIVLQSLLRIQEIDLNEIRNIHANFSNEVKKSEYSKNILSFLESNEVSEKDSVK